MTAPTRYYLVDADGWVLAGGLSLAQAGHEIARLMDEADGSHEPLPSDSVAEQLAIDMGDVEIAGRHVSLLSDRDLGWLIPSVAALDPHQPDELDPCL